MNWGDKSFEKKNFDFKLLLMSILNNFIKIQDIVKSINLNCKIIAVTKSQSFELIKPLLDYGHNHFGENKVQEAKKKWSTTLEYNNNIKLHLVGRLQSNKAEDAVNLFTHIHSLDSIKLAKKLSTSELKFKKKLKYFIQVNLDKDINKGGIFIDELDNLIKLCQAELQLDIIGLMCLPSISSEAIKIFSKLRETAIKYKLPDLSMGMSNDFIDAIKCGSTHIRIGSKIFSNNAVN
jgi:pyridoxal phosphate enzyme (YggS family)